MPPCGAIGSGASRVQMTKPSLDGSPAATPRLNGKSRNSPPSARRIAGAATPARVAEAMKWRRFSMGAPKAGRLDASGLAQPLSARHRDVAALHTAHSILNKPSIRETQPSGPLLIPPTPATEKAPHKE